MNKFVKRTLYALLSEQRSNGNNLNWTTVLGATSASINLAEGRGPDQMNPYKAVYGRKIDHQVMCTKDQACACWTLPEILKVTDNPEFQEYAEDNYFLADEEDNNDSDDDTDGYFSDGPLPQDEMEEVDDELFFDHILGRETRYDMGQQCIATLCMKHHPALAQLYNSPEKVVAQSIDAAQKLNFDAQEKDNGDEVKEQVKGDGDESTTGSDMDCSTLMNTPPPLKSKEIDPSSPCAISSPSFSSSC